MGGGSFKSGFDACAKLNWVKTAASAATMSVLHERDRAFNEGMGLCF
jgi:hypothetical protein